MHLLLDIDQTLYPLLRAIGTLPGGEGVSEERCLYWHSLEEMCQRPARELIEEAVQPEVAERIGLYPGAREVVLALAERDIEIALATHRPDSQRQATEVFLQSSGLGDFPLFVGADLQKENLLFPDGILVDDSPFTLRAAFERGLLATTLRHRYNDQVSSQLQIPRAANWLELGEIIEGYLQQAATRESVA